MWEQYRKRFLFNQLFAAIGCAASYFYFFPGKIFLVVVLLISIEVGAVWGAWWAARLIRSIEASEKKLPLE